MAVQVYFSVYKGGYFPEQWYKGVWVLLGALGASALIPGYYAAASMGRKQWVLVAILALFAGVVAASVLWSISRELSVREAARTTMYAGVFVLLLPAAVRWSALIVDAVVFGGLLPPALFGLLQKIYPTLTPYTGFDTLENDPRASSTLGYHPTFGMMCAIGAVLCVARMGSFGSPRAVLLRALYSAVAVLFLVMLYFTFSRGAVLALVGGALALLVFSGRRFEVLGNLAIPALAASWVILEARALPGLVTRPVSRPQMQVDGWLLVDPLLVAMSAAFVVQAAFVAIVWIFTRYAPENFKRAAYWVGVAAVAGVVLLGVLQGFGLFQEAGGVRGIQGRLTANDVYADPEFAADPTRRYASLDGAARLGLWEIALENWREHPFTGTGGDTYQVVFEEQGSEGLGEVLHPHSMWMSLLSDTGVFAFLLFLAFSIGLLVLAAYNAFVVARSHRSRALIAGSAASVTAYLISSSVDWNWYIPASTLPFFALAAVAASRRSTATSKSGETP